MIINAIWTALLISTISSIMLFAPEVGLILPRVALALIITTAIWGILACWRGITNDKTKMAVTRILTFDYLRTKIGKDEVDDFNLSRVITAVRKETRALDVSF